MLLRGASEIRAARRSGAPGPGKVASCFHVRREELILEVAVLETRAFHQRRDLFCFGDIAGERLLAGKAGKLALPALNDVDDLLDVLDARVIRSCEPDGVDR